MVMTMTAQVSVDGEGGNHPRNIEVSLDDDGFVISQGEGRLGQESVLVKSDVQAIDLIMAIRAMAAAHGWEV